MPYEEGRALTELEIATAMSYPGEGVEGMYRNDITQVAAYLDHKHGDHYMIFNLSERLYNFELFHGRVIDYGWPDHHGPPLQVLVDVVSNIDRWIRSDPKNVAIVHCLAGRGRTGTAICAYLCYSGYFASMAKALQYYANVRSNKGKGVTQPSQLRYCKYVDIILNRSFLPKPKSLSISRITITPIPTMTSQLGIRPILNIYRYAPGVQELIWTSLKDRGEATFYGPKEGEITFNITDITPVSGDVMIKLSHVTTWMWVGSKTEVILRLILNTSFLADGNSVLTLTKRDLDIAHKDNRFAANTQLFLYSSSIPDAPPPPKTDWDPEKFDIWAENARQYRARYTARDAVDHSEVPNGADSASSSGPSSSSSPIIDITEPMASHPALSDDPSTVTFNPFVPPTASSTPPVPDKATLECSSSSASGSSNGSLSSPIILSRLKHDEMPSPEPIKPATGFSVVSLQQHTLQAPFPPQVGDLQSSDDYVGTDSSTPSNSSSESQPLNADGEQISLASDSLPVTISSEKPIESNEETV